MEWQIVNDAYSWYRIYFNDVRNHSAKGFPNLYYQIISHLCSEYGIRPESHIIIDPMCGIGTTMIVANVVNKQFRTIGVEVEYDFYKEMVGYVKSMDSDLFGSMSKWIDGNITKALKLINADIEHEDKDGYCVYKANGEDICHIFLYDSTSDSMAEFVKEKAHIDLPLVMVTSPSYMHQNEYSIRKMDSLPKYIARKLIQDGYLYRNERNIAFISNKQRYKDMLCKVYENCFKLGVEIGVIVTRDFVNNGKVVELWKLNEEAMVVNGYSLVERIKAKLPFRTVFKNFNKKLYERGIPDIDYEDVCFYKKGV